MSEKHSSRVPSYRRHKSTNQAVVTIDGKDFYLGTWNTKASKIEYDRLIAEWMANGRRLRSTADITVVEVVNAYRNFAQEYYRRNGIVTREFGCIKEALKLVCGLYGRTNANDFGPLALKAVRQKMLDNGWSRGYINKAIGRVRRCFKWAVENELVRPDMYHGLMAVSGLRKVCCEPRKAIASRQRTANGSGEKRHTTSERHHSNMAIVPAPIEDESHNGLPATDTQMAAIDVRFIGRATKRRSAVGRQIDCDIRLLPRSVSGLA